MVLSAWDLALKARGALEAEPAGTRTRAQFRKVLDGFRAVYHDEPRDRHAADAVQAVAELLAEEGRELDDEKASRAAVGQYDFLRTAYPGSALRGAALLAEARIERDDLGDVEAARAKFAELLRESPRSEAGRAARGEAAALEVPTHRDEAAMNGARMKPGRAVRGLALTERNAAAVPADTASPGDKPRQRRGESSQAAIEVAGAQPHDNLSAAPQDDHGAPRLGRGLVAGAQPHDNPSAAPQDDHGAPRAGTKLASVTGIRHWSTRSYTRVAIDLGDEVKFEAARVPNPDRIYFDLHGARLAQELVGKSFDVTDDGFLKRIRAAQAGGDVTRVVLDVNDVTEYSAFLLPNPYRLIIDIHGRKEDGAAARDLAVEKPVEVPAAVARTASAAANVSGLPAMAVTDGGEAVRPVAVAVAASARPHDNLGSAAVIMGHPAAGPAPLPAKAVPNTVTVRSPGAAVEVAAVSNSPGKVEATSAPTSKPIAVKNRNEGSKNREEGKGIKDKGTASAVPVVAAAVPVDLGAAKGSGGKALPVKAADKTADGETSLIRALGLKIGRIVIDAGHGGHDSGTLGVDGIEEKDVVLDVALRLGRMLHERLGAEIIYTRSDDTFIPLETRTAIANKAQADLFLSIHANSSQDASARGVETYYLNFTSDATALDVAARENAVSGQSIHQLSDLVKKITLKDKIAESREFAADVEGSLFAGLTRGNAGLRDRGVKKAPFVVLIGANMPSILAEISFVTNAKDAEQLREPDYRQRVAESLYAGVAKYEGGLAGARPVALKRASLQ